MWKPEIGKTYHADTKEEWVHEQKDMNLPSLPKQPSDKDWKPKTVEEYESKGYKTIKV